MAANPRMLSRRGRMGGHVAWLLVLLAAGSPSCSRTPERVDRQSSAPPARIISLVPSLTESLFAIGAGPQVVGIGSFDTPPSDYARLPRVGALLDPDVERILSLRPDLVLLYGSQVELQRRLDRVGIRTYPFRHSSIDGPARAIGELGTLTGHQAEAAALTERIREGLDALARHVRGRSRPRTLLVMERQPGSLRGVYASGGVGFLHELLTAAGGANVFADVPREAVQPSKETLLDRAPDVIIEVRADPIAEGSSARVLDPWNVLTAVPAVRNRRVYLLTGSAYVIPGPRLVQAAEGLARVLHPDAFR